MIHTLFLILFCLQSFCAIEKIIHIPIFNQHTINKTLKKNLKRIKKLHPDYQYIIYSNHILNEEPGFLHKTLNTNEPLITSLEFVYQDGGLLIDPNIYLKSSLTPLIKNETFVCLSSNFPHLPQHTKDLINPAILGAKKNHPLLKQALENMKNCKPLIYTNNDQDSALYYFYHKYLVPLHNTLKKGQASIIHPNIQLTQNPFALASIQDPVYISTLRWAKKTQGLSFIVLLQTFAFLLFLILKKPHKQYNQ